MLKSFSLVLVLLFTITVFAFDDAPLYKGTINRPGYSNLQVRTDGQSSGLDNGYYYAENNLVGTPNVMLAQYQSHAGIGDYKALADGFIADNYNLFKNSPENFRIASSHFILNKFYFVNLIQVIGGVEVWGSRLNLKTTPAGKIFLAGGEIFSDIDVNTMPSIPIESARQNACSGIIYNASSDKVLDGGLYILPLIFDDEIEYHLCYKFDIATREPIADWQVFVDADDGTVIWREDMIRYETVSGNISGYMQPATAYDVQELWPYPNTDIIIDDWPITSTDSDGDYSFDLSAAATFIALFQGPFLNVENQAGPDAFFDTTVYPGDIIDIEWNDDNSTIPERDAFYHGQKVHDFIKSIDPNLEVMDFPLTCRVNVDGNCNAYWSSQDRSINFYRQGANCPNIAQIADVIYHEYGHGITHLQYEAGGSGDPNGAMHEGFSDFIAGLITDQPLIGRGFYGPGSHLRTIDNDNRYPDDWIGESHNDGLIISGALWDLKLMLDDDRPGYVDTLWHFAKYGYSTNFDDYFWDVLAVDDDDGDLDNGTPHSYEIFYSFGELHGIGPGVPIEIEHTPISDTEDSTAIFAVEATVSSQFSMDDGSVTIYYSTGGDYNEIPMANLSGDLWAGDIPNQSFGTTVSYYIEVIDHANLRKYSPAGAPDSVYSFYVGFDTIPPVITDAVGQENTINIAGPYGPFSFRAWDTHGLDQSSAQLHFQVNNWIYETRSMHPEGETGDYMLDELDLGESLVIGDSIHYYFTIRDLAINPNIGRLPLTGTFSFTMSDSEIIDNFEAGIDNWTVEGDGWIPFANQGYQSNACIKTFAQLYDNNANSIIYFNNPFNFAPFNYTGIEFWRRAFMLDGDSCYAIASHDPAGPWTRCGAIGGAGSTWIYSSFELEGFAGYGNDEVYVGFQFISDDSGNHYGILIDNATVRVAEPTSITESDQIPESYGLNQNYPNPFNMNTMISFSIPQKSFVTLDIYDILGRRVVNLLDCDIEAGNHQVIWNGRNNSGEVVTSGIYFYRLGYDNNSEIKSMTLIK
jgi:Zn-dependent metalloprotease